MGYVLFTLMLAISYLLNIDEAGLIEFLSSWGILGKGSQTNWWSLHALGLDNTASLGLFTQKGLGNSVSLIHIGLNFLAF